MWPFEKLHPQMNLVSPNSNDGFFWGIHIFGQFQKCWDFCEHNWWYSSMLLEKKHLFFLWSCTRTKKQMLRTNQKSRTLLRWHWELKIWWLGNPSKSIYLVVALDTFKKKQKSHKQSFPKHFPGRKSKICETTTIGIIPKPTDKVFEGMIWGTLLHLLAKHLDV